VEEYAMEIEEKEKVAIAPGSNECIYDWARSGSPNHTDYQEKRQNENRVWIRKAENIWRRQYFDSQMDNRGITCFWWKQIEKVFAAQIIGDDNDVREVWIWRNIIKRGFVWRMLICQRTSEINRVID